MSTHDVRGEWLSRTRVVLSPRGRAVHSRSVRILRRDPHGRQPPGRLVGHRQHLRPVRGDAVRPVLRRAGAVPGRHVVVPGPGRARDSRARHVGIVLDRLRGAAPPLRRGRLDPAAPGTPQPGHAFWFVVLAAITAVAAIASLGISVGLFGVLSTLATASLLVAIGLWAPAPVLETNRRMGVRDLCGDRLVRRQRDAAATGDGPYRGADRRVGEGGQRPGAVPAYPMEYRAGMPGSKVGQ